MFGARGKVEKGSVREAGEQKGLSLIPSDLYPVALTVWPLTCFIQSLSNPSNVFSSVHFTGTLFLPCSVRGTLLLPPEMMARGLGTCVLGHANRWEPGWALMNVGCLFPAAGVGSLGQKTFPSGNQCQTPAWVRCQREILLGVGCNSSPRGLRKRENWRTFEYQWSVNWSLLVIAGQRNHRASK